MVSVLIWAVMSLGLFIWNTARPDLFVGIRFTEKLVGYPIDGGWLAAVLAVYCLVREIVRRRRRAAAGASGDAPGKSG